MNLPWIFNWNLFRQCNSWKKNEPFYKHTTELEDGKSNKWTSCLSCLTPFLLLIASPFLAFLHLWTLHRLWQQEQPNHGWPASFSCPPKYLAWFGHRSSSDAYWSRSLTCAFWVFPGRTNLFSKGSKSNCVKLCNPYGLCHSHFCCCTAQAATENTQPHEHGWVPVKTSFTKHKKSRQQAIVCNPWFVLSHLYGKSGFIIHTLTNRATCHMALSYVP